MVEKEKELLGFQTEITLFTHVSASHPIHKAAPSTVQRDFNEFNVLPLHPGHPNRQKLRWLLSSNAAGGEKD